MDTESPSKNFQPYLFLYDSLDFFLSCNSGLWSRKVAVCATMERTFSSLEAFLLLSSASSGAYCTKYLAPGCGFEILELPGQPMPCHHLKERGRWSEIAAVGFLRQRRWWWCFIFIGPRCPWGPIFGSGCLSVRPSVRHWDTFVKLNWWRYQLITNW